MGLDAVKYIALKHAAGYARRFAVTDDSGDHGVKPANAGEGWLHRGGTRNGDLR